MSNNWHNIFEQFAQQKVLIIGDAMIDAYMWGNINRQSPEADVTIINIEKHENEIIKYGEEILRKNNSVKLIGNPKNRGGVLSFNIDGIHPHDIATVLDEDGVAIRAGHHCCQILHKKLNLTASARASVGIYNTKEDFEKLNESINKCKKVFDI